jgi:hypothetical protein
MSAATANYFTRWHRAMDNGALALVTEGSDGRVLEWIELDVTELPARPELLCRLAPWPRARLLWEAREVAKGNPTLSSSFPGYSTDGLPPAPRRAA